MLKVGQPGRLYLWDLLNPLFLLFLLGLLYPWCPKGLWDRFVLWGL
jgi:hypothetical protein